MKEQSLKKRKIKKTKKIFVLDTSVLLFDNNSLYSFQEHDIVIPIVVLEELDKFKKGNDVINYTAREVIRELDKLTEDRLFAEGVSLGEGRGKLLIYIHKKRSELVEKTFSAHIPDHQVIAAADLLRQEHPNQPVIIVSKDINLRMKAKSVGILAEDYETVRVSDFETLTSNIKIIENVDKEIIAKFYYDVNGVSHEELKFIETPKRYEYFVFRNGSTSALAIFNPVKKIFERANRINAYGIEPRNAEQTFALDILTRDEIKLVGITGKAGTGKTLIALASALHQKKKYSQIYLARPIVPLSNKDIGYLPGDIKSKIDPYMQPLWDNLNVIKNKFAQDSQEYKRIQEMIQQEKLIISPLAYIRGRSLENIFFIVDEAQNLTPHEVKTIITRAGERTKMVFCGDIFQIDTPYLDYRSNGLAVMIEKMKGQDIFAHINLVKGERSELAELASNLL
jgi:PhoH-like ATPase